MTLYQKIIFFSPLVFHLDLFLETDVFQMPCWFVKKKVEKKKSIPMKQVNIYVKIEHMYIYKYFMVETRDSQNKSIFGNTYI